MYDKSKTPVEILNELIRRYPESKNPPLYIHTTYDPISQTYRSSVRVDSLASMVATDLTETACKKKAQLKLFNFLRDLNNLIGE